MLKDNPEMKNDLQEQLNLYLRAYEKGELEAWDKFMASAFKDGVSAKKAAEWADLALVERRKRWSR